MATDASGDDTRQSVTAKAGGSDEVAVAADISSQRRYDIDWLRVIAIGILVVFHIMIMFQSYAIYIRFIQSPVLLEGLIIPLSLFSVFRIPLLFFVSGMGVFFSLQRRTWLQLLGERTKRILVPLVFGSVAIVPVHKYIFAKFYMEEFSYVPDAAHLWFLINIYMYVLWFLSLFYFAKQFQNSKFLELLRRLIQKYPFAIYILAIPYVLQSLTIPAHLPYTLYFESSVGLLLGAVAFLLGFTIIALGEAVWKAVSRIKYYILGLALALYLCRILVYDTPASHPVMSIESISWVFGVFGLGYAFLNKPGRVLGYLSGAAYPIYVIHMIFLYLGAYFIFPMNINPWASLLLIIAFTFAGCFASYEILRRIFFLRPLLGMKAEK